MGSTHPYTTAAGKRMYRISYRAPDQSQRTKRGFRTKRDAELALAQVAIAKSRGEFIDPSDAAVTVDTIGEQWLQQRRGVLKPSSFRPLESAWRKHVQPKWGARTVGSIRHSEVQSCLHGPAMGRGHRAPRPARRHPQAARERRGERGARVIPGSRRHSQDAPLPLCALPRVPGIATRAAR